LTPGETVGVTVMVGVTVAVGGVALIGPRGGKGAWTGEGAGIGRAGAPLGSGAPTVGTGAPGRATLLVGLGTSVGDPGCGAFGGGDPGCGAFGGGDPGCGAFGGGATDPAGAKVCGGPAAAGPTGPRLPVELPEHAVRATRTRRRTPRPPLKPHRRG